MALVAAVLQLHPEHETDSFWQMTLGRAVLRAGARVVPEPTAFTGTAPEAFAPEWLWGLTAYLVHEAGGMAAGMGLVALCAAFGAAGVVLLLRRWHPEVGLWPTAFVAALTVAMMTERFRLRPESGGLVLAVAFLAATHGYRGASRERAVRWGAGLVALEILWAQVHGSFVLAPAIFALGAVRLDEHRQRDLAVAGALALGLASSAYGLDFASYIRTHAAGDAVRHIIEMRALSWAFLDPAANPVGVVYLAGWLVCAIGAAGLAGAEERPWRELALALLGAVLVVVTPRFIAFAAVLHAPLALAAASAFLRSPRVGMGAALLGLLAIAAVGRNVHKHAGPWGRVGLSPSGFPVLSRAFVAQSAVGQNVITTFDAGAPLGFWLDGAARTWVDGRTPLFWTDPDFALSRQAFMRPHVMARVADRYEARVVVDHRAPLCPARLSKAGPGGGEAWSAVVVDPIFTTFVRGDSPQALKHIAPCGDDYLAPKACADGGAGLDAEIARLAALGETPFVGFLRAERVLRCGGDAVAAAGLIPNDLDAWYYRPQRDRLKARLLLAQNQPDAAIALLAPRIEEGDIGALRVVWDVLVDHPDRVRVRELLAALAETLDDDTPRGIDGRLADLCVSAGDHACVRFHALRAAARGSRKVASALRWLAKEAPEAHVRADAEAWLRRLERAPAEAAPPEP